MRRPVTRALKRTLDIVAAALGLIVLSPLILLVALALRLRMGSPVLFRQQRTGYRGRRFTIYKFRTMSNQYDASGRLLPDRARVTRLGRFLRALSLDEIPQLVNVLKGDMSIVGPRPWIPKYDHWYSPDERRRFEVRPGITGLAQIKGRNTVSWTLRLSYDIEYVERLSLWLDLKILLATVKIVLTAHGVAEDQRQLMDDLDDERGEALTDEMILTPEERKLLRAG